MLARFSTLDSKQRQLGRAIRSVLKRVEDRMNLTSEAPTDDDEDAIAPTTPTDRLNWSTPCSRSRPVIPERGTSWPQPANKVRSPMKR